MTGLFSKKTTDIPPTGGSVLGSITINWEDQDKQNNVMWKVPRNIRLNDNIVVREDEIAVFYRDGKVLTYFDQPNRYALTDFTAPIVGNLLKFFTGVQQQAGDGVQCEQGGVVGAAGEGRGQVSEDRH